MYKVTEYPHGAFAWVDNTSTDAEAAKDFYAELFGWGKIEVPIGEGTFYTLFQNQGEHVAGFAPMMPDLKAQGIPSHWTNYVKVDDVDALAEVVTANGGTILFGPMDVFDSGRMLHLQDPTGAQLGLWQPINHKGAGIVNTVGAMCWNELLTKDAAVAKDFYSKLLGWEFSGDDHYIHITNRGRNNGGMMQMTASMGDMPSHWMPYFHVANIEDGMKRVEELGGDVVVGKNEAPETGFWSIVKDPAGAHFYIMQLFKADAWED